MKLVCCILTSWSREKVIKDCLRSVINWVDEVIIIHIHGPVILNAEEPVGDRTLKIAKKICGDKLKVIDYLELGPYPEVHWRQRALIAAERAGADWMIPLDTDERIVTQPGNIKDVLAKVHPDDDVLNIWHKDHTYLKHAFFRIPNKGQWRYNCHEEFQNHGNIALLDGLLFEDIPKSNEQFAARSRIDIPYLEEQLALEPENFRWYFYLGVAYKAIGDRDRAIETFRAGIPKDMGYLQKSYLCHQVACVLVEQEKKDEAMAELMKGLWYSPMLAEIHWLASLLCYGRGQHEEAKNWYDRFLANKDLKLDIYFRNIKAMETWSPYYDTTKPEL